jgi:hypothetical protein
MKRLVALLSVFALTACGSYTLEWDGGTLGGVSLVHEAGLGKSLVRIRSGAPVAAELFPGELVHLTFLAKGALPLGTIELLADGDGAIVPPEAVEALIALDPPATFGRFSYGGSWNRPVSWPYRLFPVAGLELSRARVIDFRVSAVTRAVADQRALEFLRRAPSDPVSLDVTAGLHVTTWKGSKSFWCVQVASLKAPTYASLTVNGWSHSGLPGTTYTKTGAWYFVTFAVPNWVVGYRPAVGGPVSGEVHVLKEDGEHAEGTFALQLAPL